MAAAPPSSNLKESNFTCCAGIATTTLIIGSVACTILGVLALFAGNNCPTSLTWTAVGCASGLALATVYLLCNGQLSAHIKKSLFFLGNFIGIIAVGTLVTQGIIPGLVLGWTILGPSLAGIGIAVLSFGIVCLTHCVQDGA